ncbi:hypothetical protein JCM11641_007899, partial [Rhodosporidiobolus odoratus]
MATSQPYSPGSNPADAWASNNRFAPIAPQSEANSIRSTGSIARRAAAAAAAEVERRRRLAAFEAEEARIRQATEAELDQADEASAVVKGKGGIETGQPVKSAVEAEVEVVRRELADLESRRNILRRYLNGRFGKNAVLEEEEVVMEPEELASVSVCVKVNPPQAWKGSYDRTVREAWIKTVEGYFAAIGLKVQARLSESSTPYPFHLLRSLFSPDQVNGLSALAWFDARHRRSPFTSALQVLEAVRSHWKDDQAADAALAAYRSARQGSLRARDFGAKVETLGDACFDRTIDEADRVSSFVAGLNANYREFLKTQLATLKTMGRAPVTLSAHVDLAAAADGLDSFTSSLKKTGGVSSSPSSSSSPSK